MIFKIKINNAIIHSISVQEKQSHTCTKKDHDYIYCLQYTCTLQNFLNTLSPSPHTDPPLQRQTYWTFTQPYNNKNSYKRPTDKLSKIGIRARPESFNCTSYGIMTRNQIFTCFLSSTRTRVYLGICIIRDYPIYCKQDT